MRDNNNMANTRLSYSQARLYAECGMKYKFHYKDRLRERTKGGALLFGSAFDTGTRVLLDHFVEHGNWDFDEKAAFDAAWSVAEINGKKYDAPECTLIGYGAADFDLEILTSDDLKFLLAKTEELCPALLVTVDEKTEKERPATPGEVQSKLAHYKSLNDNKKRLWRESENKLHNLFNWMALRRKGHLMLDANRAKVLPRIKTVLGVQKAGNLTNDDGDSVISYLDLECIWEDGRHVIFDYKTSAREYDTDAVLVSQQLSIYSYTHSVPYGGYFVFRKQIKKNREKVCTKCNYNGSGGRHKTCNNEIDGARCGGQWEETIRPECEVDILIDEIPKRTQDIVMENLNTINNGIKSELFTRNFNSCKNGYGRCPYFNKCYKDDDSELEPV